MDRRGRTYKVISKGSFAPTKILCYRRLTLTVHLSAWFSWRQSGAGSQCLEKNAYTYYVQGVTEYCDFFHFNLQFQGHLFVKKFLHRFYLSPSIGPINITQGPTNILQKYRVLIKYCVFSKILIYFPDSVFSRCQCVYTRQAGRAGTNVTLKMPTEERINHS